MSGYVRSQRDRFGHPLFVGEKFCRGYAWDWIIAKAAWKETTYDVKGKIVDVQRGQFVASPDEMAKAWNWSRSSVIRFLLRLKTEHMIDQSAEHNKTLITVCNYDKYQAEDVETEQDRGRKSGHKADTKRTAKEEREEGKEREAEASLGAKSRKRRSSIPFDAVMTDTQRALAHAHGLSDAEAEAQFVRFRDSNLAKGQVYADWDKAWGNWLNSPYFRPLTGTVHQFPSKNGKSHGERLDQLYEAASDMLAQRPFPS
jgi:Arc/MetJ-type ribon-helix-helix transcriptional regulator